MTNKGEFPKTLQQAIIYFADAENASNFLMQMRWPNGVECPVCDGREVSYLSTRRLWKCKACKKQFSVKVGSIMEDSPIGLDRWLAAIWLIVEVDETYIGGKARNMHRSALAKRVATFATPLTGRNQNIGKMAVMGLLERHGGEVRTMVVGGTKRRQLHGEVTKHVEAGSVVYTDALRSYNQLGESYIHNVINHAEKYVDGQIHTNGIENFWSLLKRSIRGTYVSVEPFHLFRYLDEQSFRFNTRKGTDADRFVKAAAALTGKRLTYEELIGKKTEPETSH